MTIREALASVDYSDEDFFALLQQIYEQKYTGLILLHCFEGQPKCADFPGRQVKLKTKKASSHLTNARHSSTL